jgi:hypothetical protein
MWERAQASVETIALLAAALAVSAALMLGVLRLGPPLAASIGGALSGAFGPGGAPTAPGLDPLERLLIDGATSAEDDGPTLLDLRTQLRSRLDRPAADAAFDVTVRTVVARTFEADAIDAAPGRIDLIDQEAEDAWVRDRFNPGMAERAARVTASLLGLPGAIYSLATDTGLVSDEPDALEAGHAAGDLVVHARGGSRELILRRQPGEGLTVIADRTVNTARGGVR